MTETEIKQGLKNGELWGSTQGGAKQLIAQDGQKSKAGRYILQQKLKWSGFERQPEG